MYILLISRGVPSKKDPLWGCFEFDQARALKSIGHKVIVLSVDERVRFYKRKIGLSHQLVDGIDCYNYCLLPKKLSEIFGFNISSKVSYAHYNFVFQKIVQEHGTPDVIYSHYLTTSYVATLLKKKWNIPLVAIEHWSEINKDKLTPWVKKVGQLTYANVDKLISVSRSLQDRIKQHFGVYSTVIHNMVGADFFNRPNYFRLEGKITFVTTGRLVYGKGFDLLPKAFAKLNLPKEIWEMNIIGGGEEYNNLQKQIKELDLQDNIYLLGQKTKSQVVDILKTSDIFILPSRAENFSVAVLEALACGLPVISSDCGGIRECIFDFNGRLFPVDDVDLLADSIRHIFENYQSYDKVQIAEDCKNRFSPEVIAHQLTDVFNEIISKHK